LLALFLFLSLKNDAFLLPDSHEFIAITGINDSLSSLEIISKRTPVYSFFSRNLGVGAVLVLQHAAILLVSISFFRFLKRTNAYLPFWLWLVSIIMSLNIFIYANKIMAEVLCLTLLWLAFWALIKKQGLLFWLPIILLPFTKPVFIFLPIAVMILGFFHSYFRNKQILLGCALSLLLIGLYSAYNFKMTGSAEFSSIQHINALTYNRYQFDVSRFGEAKALAYQDSVVTLGETLPYPEKVSLYNKGLKDALKEAPLLYAWFHISGAMRGIIDPGRFDLEPFIPSLQTTGFLHRKQGSMLAYLKSLPVAVWLVLLPLALFNLLRLLLALYGFYKLPKTPENLFGALAIIYVVLVTGPINASRFMVPVVPFLIYFSLMGFAELPSNLFLRLRTLPPWKKLANQS
jgi:hypothetical protein